MRVARQRDRVGLADEPPSLGRVDQVLARVAGEHPVGPEHLPQLALDRHYSTSLLSSSRSLGVSRSATRIPSNESSPSSIIGLR